MQFSTIEVEEAKEAYKKTKLKTKIMLLPMKVALVIFIAIRFLFEEQFNELIETANFFNIRLDIIFAVFAAAILGLGFITTFIWKCPHCDRRFGREQNMKHCMHCGIELED